MFDKIKIWFSQFKIALKRVIHSSFLVFAGVVAGAAISTCTFTACGSRNSTNVVVENNASGTSSEFTVSSPNEISFSINTIKEEEK